MSTYTITPLHLGDITRPKSNMISGYEGTEVLDFPLIAYYLEGKHKILVDTGGSDPESAQGKKAAPYKRPPEQALDAALKAIGVAPEDIEYVILTHLHWDHAANNHLFPNATFFCQKIEYESLLDPNIDKKGYDMDSVLKTKYELLDGDRQVFDGISVVLTPGHTPGLQSVVVDTDDGKAVLTGDLVTLRESLGYDPPRANALLYDDSAYGVMQESLKKVLAISRNILPGHDPGVFAPTAGAQHTEKSGRKIDFGKRLGMGCLRLPVFDESKQAEIDMETAQKIIDLFMEQGYNYFDTSYVYHSGNSEAALGKLVVDRYPRDSFLISTKMPLKWMHKQEEQETVFQEQLDRCHLEYFDFYLIHAIMRDTYELSKKWGTWDFLKKKRAEGKFREFGVSMHDTPEFLDEILTEHPEIDFVILQINYVDWENPVIRARESYEVAMKHGVPVVVMEACKGGTLAIVPEEAEALMKAYNPDASIASWAFRFVGSLPGVRVVLAGMPKMEFLLDNLKTFNDFKPLNAKEYEILDKVCKIINENTAIACTTCRYCEPKCPKNIPIPDYFNLYNDMKRFQKTSNPNRVNVQANYYESWLKGGRGAASSCINCKVCEKACPQGLPIAKLLAEYIKPELEDYQHRSQKTEWSKWQPRRKRSKR